jgi:hypothetical protein
MDPRRCAQGRASDWKESSTKHENLDRITRAGMVSSGFAVVLAEFGVRRPTHRPGGDAAEQCRAGRAGRWLHPLVYQWQFNGINVAGATHSTLILTNVPLASAGTYQCLASNPFGSVPSQTASLTVIRSTLRLDASSAALQLGNAGFSLTLQDLSGHGPVILYASSNLLHWEPILTNPPVLGVLQLLDAGATNLPARFYRAAEE